MANDREQELVLLGKLISNIEAMDKKLDTFSSGVYKRMGKAEDNLIDLAKEVRENRESDLKELAKTREDDLTALNTKIVAMDKQVSKNTWIIGGAGTVAMALLIALLKLELL